MSENLPAIQKSNIPMIQGQGLTPQDFDGLWRLSTVMCASGCLPTSLKTPEAVFVTLNMGAELGLSPMASVQNISVINGRPVVWGDAMLALVRSSGVMFDFKETTTGTFPNDNFTARCSCKRGSEDIERSFSIADARAAGLWQYPTKGPSPWAKYPKRMLQMRARSWALRDGFADVLKGISCREEYQEVDAETSYNADTNVYEPVTPDPQTPAAPTTPPKEPTPPAPDFEELVADKNIDSDMVGALEEYIDFVCKEKGTDRGEIEKTASIYFDRFWQSFEHWLNEQQAPAEPPVDEGGMD